MALLKQIKSFQLFNSLSPRRMIKNIKVMKDDKTEANSKDRCISKIISEDKSGLSIKMKEFNHKSRNADIYRGTHWSTALDVKLIPSMKLSTGKPPSWFNISKIINSKVLKAWK